MYMHTRAPATRFDSNSTHVEGTYSSSVGGPRPVGAAIPRCTWIAAQAKQHATAWWASRTVADVSIRVPDATEPDACQSSRATAT